MDLAQELLRRLDPVPLIEFVPRLSPAYDAPTHLLPLVRLLEEMRIRPVRGLSSVPPRHGKALAVGTSMLTPRGFVPAGDLRIGDMLRGSDGRWTEITGVFPQGVVPLYRVRFSDGAQLTVCGSHLWQVRDRYGYGRGRQGAAWQVRTTNELARDLYEADGRKKWQIPIVAPLEAPEDPYPLDPYLLGVWLGDGTTLAASITTADPEIVDVFRACGFAPSYIHRKPGNKAATYGFRNGLWALLKNDLAVLGRKHIPPAYLHGSVSARLALLQGMADTDGTVAKDGSAQSITTTSEQLACDLKFLINSLGGVWTEYTRPAAQKIAHTVSFRLPPGMDAFRLARKGKRLAPSSLRNRPRRFIRAIEYVGDGEAVCFQVAAVDRLFCAGPDLVVTHNSETIIHGIVWLLVQDPTRLYGYVSYGDSFSRSISRRCRRLALEAGVQLADDSKSVGEWRTTAGGGLVATGVMGGLTGRGFHGIVYDDPVKNWEEATSQITRDKIWEEFEATVSTRLEPGGSILVNGTRWHLDDLIGRLSQSPRWERFNLPAISEVDGREVALWPKRFPLEVLQEIRAEKSARIWQAQYQGSPVPDSGGVFKKDWFSTVPAVPPVRHRTVIAFDGAWKTGIGNDYSAISVWAMDASTYYCLDAWHGKQELPQLERTLQAYADKWRPEAILIEDTASGTALIQSLRPRTRLPLIPWKVSTSKTLRAEAVAPLFESGRVKLVQGAWNDAFITEHCAFPAGAHDDWVDTTSMALGRLQQQSQQPRPTQPFRGSIYAR